MTKEERQKRLETEVPVYVPRPGSYAASEIAPGSGIVGEPWEDGRILLYYEGHLIRALNIVTYADRVLHAAGCMAARYPGSAFMAVKADEVIEVGVYHPMDGRVEVTDPCALEAFLGSYTEDELLTTGGKGARRRELLAALERAHGNPAVRDFVNKEAARQGIRL